MAMHIAYTSKGAVSGVPGNNPTITVFKGIPYAAPPVGENRWKAPADVEPWQGILKANEFKGGCTQPPVDEFNKFNMGEPFEPFSEDCLYLNVWTPAESSDEKLPVFLWIHGGANMFGWGHFPFVDGEGFCKRGVIFVSFNWRVNVFGWLTHPELDLENDEHISGNYGVLDQIAALKWVKENIAAFGGDPENITVAGESAGGSSTQNMCNTPLTKGLFQHAIMQSGGGWDLFIQNSVPTLSESEKVTDLMRLFGVSSIAEARKLSAEELLNRSMRPEAAGAFIPMHVVDGVIFEKSNKDIMLSGETHAVDYMIGHTFEETHMYEMHFDRDAFISEIRADYGPYADEYLSYCDFLNNDNSFKEHLRVRSAEALKTGVIAFAEQLDSEKRPVYTYCFTGNQPGLDGGAYHSAELWYQFETLGRSWRPFTGADYELSSLMADYWTNFAKYGNPNSDGLPTWEKYTCENHKMMDLGYNPGMKDFGENERVTLRKKIISSK